MTNFNWKVIKKRMIKQHKRFTAFEETVELPDGRIVDDYLQISLCDYCLIIPVTVDGKFLLFEQYKHGPASVCLAFPGGQIDENEGPLDAAKRELFEELDVVSNEWQSFGKFSINGNQGCGNVHIYAATQLPHQTKISDQLNGDLEHQTLRCLSHAQMQKEIYSGKFKILAHAYAASIALSL